MILEIHLTSLHFRFHKCTIRWKCSKNYHTNENLKTLHRLFSTELELKYGKGKVKSLSYVQLFATPWIVAFQAPPSMGFSRQEKWSGLPFPSPGDLPHQESNLHLQQCRQILYCLSHQAGVVRQLCLSGFLGPPNTEILAHASRQAFLLTWLGCLEHKSPVSGEKRQREKKNVLILA